MHALLPSASLSRRSLSPTLWKCFHTTRLETRIKEFVKQARARVENPKPEKKLKKGKTAHARIPSSKIYYMYFFTRRSLFHKTRKMMSYA